MGWLEDAISSLQQGGAPFSMSPQSPFPDTPAQQAAAQQQAEQEAAAAAREAAGARLMRANQKRPDPFGVPDANSAGVQLAMDQAPAGTGVPGPLGEFPLTDASRQMMASVGGQAQGRTAGAPDGTPFGGVPSDIGSMAGPTIPPSLQIATQIAAPPPPAPPAGPPGMPGAGPSLAPGGGGAPLGEPNVPPQPMPAPMAPARPPVAPPVTPEDGGPTDVSSRNRAAPAAPAALPPAAVPGSEPGILDRLQAFGKSVGPALMGTGASLSGDNSVTMKILAQREALAQQGLQNNATAQLLASKGATAPEIKAALVGGAETTKALLGQYLTKDKFTVVKTGETEDEFGGKKQVYKVFNSTDGTFKDVASTSAEQAKKDAGDTSSNGGGYLNKGVSAVDHSLQGDDYLNQYSPEVQAAVKNYIAGKSMPTANPRKGWTQNIKSIAQTYGASTGLPVDDATFGARRTMRNDLAKSSPGSIGGQISIGNTALGHLADMSQKAVDLGNVDVGLAGPSHLLNDIRGMTSAQAAKMEALKGAAQHYGQEVTKFYSGSPGGEAERNRFLETVNSAKTPQELAAVIETEAALMKDRISALQSNIHTTLGDEGVKEYPVIREVGKKAIDEVGTNVSRLRGGSAPAAPAAAPLKPGAYVWDPKTGGLVPK